jgi:RNA polymerase sigma-70 factor (ECF subfamily)
MGMGWMCDVLRWLSGLVESTVHALPECCNEIFKLSRYSEMSYAEIADALDISVKTVENQMGKALRELRGKLLPGS